MTWSLFAILVTFWTIYGMGMVWKHANRRALAGRTTVDAYAGSFGTIHAVRAPIREPELPDDPSAFWRYPDWDSGPIEQPFWMRPLKTPERKRDVIRVQRAPGMMNYMQVVENQFGGYAQPRPQPLYAAERNRATSQLDIANMINAVSNLGRYP